jgi:hypothetical protein
VYECDYGDENKDKGVERKRRIKMRIKDKKMGKVDERDKNEFGVHRTAHCDIFL